MKDCDVFASPTLLTPRPTLVGAAFQYAASSPSSRPRVLAASRPFSASRVAWSAAEAVAGLRHAELPTEPRPGSGGPGIFVEKSVLDAYYPLNTTISLVCACHTARP